MHVHVQHETGEARIWLEPAVAVAENFGLNRKNLAAALKLAEEREDEIRAAWQEHFEG